MRSPVAWHGRLMRNRPCPPCRGGGSGVDMMRGVALILASIAHLVALVARWWTVVPDVGGGGTVALIIGGAGERALGA